MQAMAFRLTVTAILLLAAALAGSAQNIDNCCFVDRQCHSDQDWMDGFWAFQNDQCQASAQSQSQTSSQPVSGASAQVDNCCFVDRQCHSDQDWMDGFWAFQNDQCQASAQSQSQTSSQPVSGASAQVDNCCFVDRQCRTEQEWSNGYHAYQLNQCGAAGQSVRRVDQADDKRRAIRIEGSARFIAAVNASLDMLKARAPHWYVYTVFGHDWILELPEGTVVSAPQDVKVRPVAPDDGYLQAGTCEFVGYLVHYAAHNYQTQRDLALGPEILPASLPDEREALTLQIEAMEACCPGHPWLPGFRHALANIDKLEYQWWH